MKISVSSQIPLARFGSLWDEPEAAADALRRFTVDTWKLDLQQLATLGVQIKVEVEVVPEKAKALEVHVAPYATDAFDMMQQTRALLTDEQEIWERFCKLTKTNALYKG